MYEKPTSCFCNQTMFKLDIKITLLILLMLVIWHPMGWAYNIRQTLSGNGLSNSAILSMCLDDKGYLWIGTCDGVNIADGNTVHSFQSL